MGYPLLVIPISVWWKKLLCIVVSKERPIMGENKLVIASLLLCTMLSCMYFCRLLSATVTSVLFFYPPSMKIYFFKKTFCKQLFAFVPFISIDERIFKYSHHFSVVKILDILKNYIMFLDFFTTRYRRGNLERPKPLFYW